MNDIELPAVRGHNPLGLFAALGVLDVATRSLPDRRVSLRWTESLEPNAILHGPDSLDHLIALCDADRARWASSPVLTWGPNGVPLDDLKPEPDALRRWIDEVADDADCTGDRTDCDLLAALVAEGALAGKGDSKPTHLHFTAGQQRFLVMVRELRAGVDPERLVEALVGPWRYDSRLPVLGWDVRGDRIYALRGADPAKEKRCGVPGADWLGFLGLRFFPVAARRGRLVTVGCAGKWRAETFTWPLWKSDLTAPVVASLLFDGSLDRYGVAERRQLGVHELLRAPIRRSEQGGYGSFGAPEPVIATSTATDRRWPSRLAAKRTTP